MSSALTNQWHCQGLHLLHHLCFLACNYLLKLDTKSFLTIDPSLGLEVDESKENFAHKEVCASLHTLVCIEVGFNTMQVRQQLSKNSLRHCKGVGVFVCVCVSVD